MNSKNKSAPRQESASKKRLTKWHPTLSRLGLKEAEFIHRGLSRYLNRLSALEFDVESFPDSNAGPQSAIETSRRRLLSRLEELKHEIVRAS